MRTLLFCPTNRLQRETAAAIHTMRFTGALDTFFTNDNPDGEASHSNIIHNYSKAERIMQAEQYDYLFTVENDIIPPPDALLRLMKLDADIAYGVYLFRRGKPTLNIVRHDGRYKETYSLPENLPRWKEVFNTGALPCNGLGLGCTLIKRSVLDALSLHSDGGGDTDTQLMLDALRLGLRQMCDTTVICGHKHINGLTFWPTQDGYKESGLKQPPPLRKIRALKTVCYWDTDDGGTMLHENDIANIDFETAGNWVKAGIARYEEWTT